MEPYSNLMPKSNNSSPKNQIKLVLSITSFFFSIHLQMDHFNIIKNVNYFNYYLTILFANGQIKEREEGVQFQCQSPKLFRIQYNCSISLLKEKVCAALNLPSTTTLKNLYYLQHLTIKDILCTMLLRYQEMSCVSNNNL